MEMTSEDVYDALPPPPPILPPSMIPEKLEAPDMKPEKQYLPNRLPMSRGLELAEKETTSHCLLTISECRLMLMLKMQHSISILYAQN